MTAGIQNTTRTMAPAARRGRMSAACLLVVLAPAVSIARPDVSAAVQAVLSSADQDRIADQLVELGPTAVPELFDVLREQRIAGSDGAPAAQLTSRQNEAVLCALQRLKKHVLDFLQSLELAQEDAAGRTAALEILGVCGEEANLELAVLTAGGAEDKAPPRQVLLALEQAVSGILARDAAAFAEVDRLLQRTTPSAQFCLARALGSTQDARGLDILARSLGRSTLGDVFLLTQIGRCLAGPKNWEFEALLRKVRPLLQSIDPVVQREAAMVVGRSSDFESFEVLIHLLEDKHVGVREGAHWALMQISGASYRADPERWRNWLAAERRWWEHDSSRAFALLRSPREVEVVAAINSIAQHRYRRDSLARELLGAVGHENQAVSALACQALVALGSNRIVPELVELLAHPEEDVRNQIGLALQKLTGLELEPEREVWQQTIL
jgi:hypothetical protein